jgi:hypothetical protein
LRRPRGLWTYLLGVQSWRARGYHKRIRAYDIARDWWTYRRQPFPYPINGRMARQSGLKEKLQASEEIKLSCQVSRFQFARRVKRKLRMRPELSTNPDTRWLESRVKRIVPISAEKTSSTLGSS